MGWLHEFEAVIRKVERLRILKHGAGGAGVRMDGWDGKAWGEKEGTKEGWDNQM